MTLKRSGIGLALGVAVAVLPLAVAPAWAQKPEQLAEKQAARADEKAARAEEKAAMPEGGQPEEAAGEKKVDPAVPCEERTFARVFKPWHDRRHYTLALGGDFETLAEGWTLEGPAALAADSSPFLLGDALGASSLELAAGASALSPPICVGRGFPSFRFVARSVSTEQATVKVQIVYASGRVLGRGRLLPGAEWAPTKKLALSQGLFKVKRGKAKQIRLRFAVTAGTARMDDVYVDPRMWR
jgi:hypothetical protein